MYENKSFLAIIPARGGSKRLPRKNVTTLLGKPLIAWTIEAALKSQHIDEVMVTTDDKEIASVAEKYGARLPFIRPDNLADDYATRTDVIKHTIEYYQRKLGKHFDYLVFLQPTSPLRTNEDIDRAIEYLKYKKADAVISVCESEHPVQWSGVLPDNNDMSKFLGKIAIGARSQDLETSYRLNGAIYICDVKEFSLNGCIFLEKNIYAFLMDQARSVDIDTKLDFKIAEVIMGQTDI